MIEAAAHLRTLSLRDTVAHDRCSSSRLYLYCISYALAFLRRRSKDLSILRFLPGLDELVCDMSSTDTMS